MKAKAPKRAVTEERQDFESVAKRLECDEDKERFEQALAKIATADVPKSSENARRSK